jgi:hypothetical protein
MGHNGGLAAYPADLRLTGGRRDQSPVTSVRSRRRRADRTGARPRRGPAAYADRDQHRRRGRAGYREDLPGPIFGIGVSRVLAAAINGHTTRRLPETLLGLVVPVVIILYMLKFSKSYPDRVTQHEPAPAPADR